MLLVLGPQRPSGFGASHQSRRLAAASRCTQATRTTHMHEDAAQHSLELRCSHGPRSHNALVRNRWHIQHDDELANKLLEASNLLLGLFKEFCYKRPPSLLHFPLSSLLFSSTTARAAQTRPTGSGRCTSPVLMVGLRRCDCLPTHEALRANRIRNMIARPPARPPSTQPVMQLLQAAAN